MKIIKRDGTIVAYNPEKIRVAIQKANNEVPVRAFTFIYSTIAS